MYLATLYWLIPAFCFFADNIKFIKHNKFLKYIFIGIIVFFTCFSYVTGSDWWAYKISYNGHCDDFEILYNHCANFAYYLGVDYWCFSYILKLIALFFLTKILTIYPKVSWFSFGLIFCNKFFIMMMAPILRNLLAVSLLWYAIYLVIIKKSWLKAFFVCFIAFGFHKSSLITVLLIIISFIFFKIHSLLIFFLLICAFIYAPALATSLRIISIAFNVPVNPYFQSGFVGYGGLTILNLPIILSLFYILIRKKYILQIHFGKILYNFSIMSIILVPFSMQIGVFYRIKIFFDLFWAITICNLIRLESSNLIKLFISLILIMSANALLTFDLINRNNYIPYTNYFLDSEEISKVKNYTKNNSPFKILKY